MGWLSCLFNGHIWKVDGDGLTCQRCGKHIKK